VQPQPVQPKAPADGGDKPAGQASEPGQAKGETAETASQAAVESQTASAESGEEAAKTPTDSAGSQSAEAAAKARPIVLTEAQKQQQGVRVHDRGYRAGRKAVGVREELEQIEEEGSFRLWLQEFVRNHQSWSISLAFHAVVIVVLGLLALPELNRQISLLATTDLPEDTQIEQLEQLVIERPELEDVTPDIVDRVEPESLQPKIDMEDASQGVDAASMKLTDMSLDKALYNDLLSEVGRGTGQADQYGTGKGKKGTGAGLGGTGQGLGGRGGRRGTAIDRGATEFSEAAVDLALQWLANHQLPDGGWCFDHTLAPSCQAAEQPCGDPGSLPEARIAATALGVLPFLGAGQTHQVGQYKKTVAGGLNFLIKNMKVKPEGGSLYEPGGRMYSHGLATIALCEAYAMTLTPKELRRKAAAAYHGEGQSPSEMGLRRPKTKQEKLAVRNQMLALGQAAQLALNYIAYAQDPAGGGWRYEPRQAGDTSVVGWQLMGLVSGRLGYLIVDPRVLQKAGGFLDHVQFESGSNYGYTGPERGSSATQAIGLLGRMYLGWKHDHPALEQGVQALVRRGPSRGNMYYNYYATQVVHHYGGDPWESWNPRMRDSLVAKQAKEEAGHEAGSWYFRGGDHGSDKGGRLYCTALAAMTLQVYYRHLPIYGKDIFDEIEARQEAKGPKKAEDFDEDF
jgi:hypothetical protein